MLIANVLPFAVSNVTDVFIFTPGKNLLHSYFVTVMLLVKSRTKMLLIITSEIKDKNISTIFVEIFWEGIFLKQTVRAGSRAYFGVVYLKFASAATENLKYFLKT